MTSVLLAAWLSVVSAGYDTSSGLLTFVTVDIGECGGTGMLTVCSGQEYFRVVPRVGLISERDVLFRPTIGAEFVWPSRYLFLSGIVDHSIGGMTRTGFAATVRFDDRSPFWVGLRGDAALTGEGPGAVLGVRVQLWPRARFSSSLASQLMFYVDAGHAFVPQARGFFVQTSIAALIDTPF